MSDPVQLELFDKPSTMFVEGTGVPCDVDSLRHARAVVYEDTVRVNDIQIGGNHYKQLDPQPWDVISAWGMGFLDGNVVKYVARFRNKGGLVDLHKARHYLQKLIEDEEAKL